MKKVARMYQLKAYALAETARTIAYHYIDYLWLLAVFLVVALLGIGYELAVELVLGALLALSVGYGTVVNKQNKSLSESLELAQNNVEAY